ncbi:MAG: DUF2148 domain-containing protein [Firmicutes bacterium]|jgi:uncharacterized ferredoxin-like protein|nr:DUF2148 domain-containing protein [Bacillota bacterium]
MDDALKLVADLMALSARTAPKGAGKDFVVTEVITGEKLKALAEEMNRYGVETGKVNFDRDGRGVEVSGALLLVGLKGAKSVGLNCGACGYPRCADLPSIHDGPEFAGPMCVWRLLDLGIALGSAVKTASIHNVDNRIMYRVGVLARKMGLIDADVAAGVPLTATGKSPFFDR